MGYTLEKADSKEFAKWWVVYRNMNEDFSQSFAEQYVDIQDVPFCNWIMADGERVAGMIRVPNNIGDFFIITPHHDPYPIFKTLLPHDEPLHARNILSDHVHALQMVGFQIEESRRFMLRPTQAYPDVRFDFEQKALGVGQAGAIAQLMYDAFHGGIGEYGQRDVEAHRRSVDNFFETVQAGDICHQASSALFDGDKMIAACLMQPYKSHASVRFVVTHPDYQGRGLARKLMEYGINIVADEFDYVTLGVTQGNPAQSLYHSMGFVACNLTHTLFRK